MTTDPKQSSIVEDPKSKTVEGFAEMPPSELLELHKYGTPFERDTVAEKLARRLEEAQQKIVAQQARNADMRSLLNRVSPYMNSHDLSYWYSTIKNVEDDLSALAAHDAEFAAKAKAEALEEARNECARILGDTSEAVEIVDCLWAEYRAKAKNG